MTIFRQQIVLEKRGKVSLLNTKRYISNIGLVLA